MASKNDTAKVPPLSMRASLTPDTVDAEARTVELVWTTGARVMRGFYERFWEELSLDPKHVNLKRLNNGAPFMADHGSSTAEQVGVVVSAKLEGKRGTAVVRFVKAGVDPEADKLFEKIRDGIVQNVSVGYRIHKMEKLEESSDKIPVYRATSWEPYEISAVAMGADDGAGFRSAGTETNDCIFLSRNTESGTMNEEEMKAAAEAKALEERTAAEAKVKAEAIASERERISGISAAVRAAKLDESDAKRMIDAGTTLVNARAEVLEKLAQRTEASPIEGHSRVEVTADDRDQFIRGVSAGMFERSGATRMIEEAKKRGGRTFVNVDTDPAQFRGVGFQRAARLCLERKGVSTKHIHDPAVLFRMALAQRDGYAGTSDFAILLENVLYKSLRAAFDVQSDTWSRWMGTDEVQDFRASNRFELGSFGTLPVKGENEEYKNMAIPDGAKKTLTTETRGAIIGISREMLINDDLGAMNNLAASFGRTAGRSIEVAAYELLNLNSGLGPTMADSSPFFDNTARGNVSTGAALTAAALDLDRQKMRQQMDLSENDYLDLQPSILLINGTLESAARVLNADQYDPAQVGQKTNIAKGMFTDIVSSPRLGATGTKRYLFTANKEAFKCVFLAGSGQGPVMETENGWRTDGVEWKVRTDFKVQAFDPKQALYNAGQ